MTESRINLRSLMNGPGCTTPLSLIANVLSMSMVCRSSCPAHHWYLRWLNLFYVKLPRAIPSQPRLFWVSYCSPVAFKSVEF